MLSAIILLSSLLIPPDFETNQTLHFLYSFDEIIFSKLPPVFPTLNSPFTIAQTVDGPIIFLFFSLLYAIIFLICDSGIHSAIIIIFFIFSISIDFKVAP